MKKIHKKTIYLFIKADIAKKSTEQHSELNINRVILFIQVYKRYDIEFNGWKIKPVDVELLFAAQWQILKVFFFKSNP